MAEVEKLAIDKSKIQQSLLEADCEFIMMSIKHNI